MNQPADNYKKIREYASTFVMQIMALTENEQFDTGDIIMLTSLIYTSVLHLINEEYLVTKYITPLNLNRENRGGNKNHDIYH